MWTKRTFPANLFSNNHGIEEWLYLKGNDPIEGTHFSRNMIVGGREMEHWAER